MRGVWFRFYGQLNDFLPRWQRARRFAQPLRPHTSVKDAIEAAGVPHPEVDLILVNGACTDFTYHLREGDHVSVYPAFRSIDLAGVPRVGTDPPQPVRFAADVHLRKLASLLRLAGFDAILLAEDADLAEAAGREDRVALTRDVALLKRSRVRFGYWVRHTDPERQFAEILERFDLAGRMAPFARCTRCNTLLVAAGADAVAGQLLPRTRAEFTTFHRCPGCGRVYWRGSHYIRLLEILDRARARVADARRSS